MKFHIFQDQQSTITIYAGQAVYHATFYLTLSSSPPRPLPPTNMAGAAEKKQAQRNLETLSSVHKLSAIVNAITLLSLFLLGRPSSGKKWYFIFSIPAFACQYIAEKIGRPRYNINADGYKVLVRAGDDLQQAGLTEYMFDIIYLTLLIDILTVVFGTMKVWYLLLVVPAYACWKLKGVFSMALGVLQMFIPGLKFSRGKKPEGAAGVNGSGEEEPLKSKRQQKMEKRANKQQVRYR
jgi:hypothetical protein